MGVGSRALFDSRCAALRQLSLIFWQLCELVTNDMQLVCTSDGQELLGGERLNVCTLESLRYNSPFRASFDPDNPVCEYMSKMYKSVRDTVLFKERERERAHAHTHNAFSPSVCHCSA